MKIVKKREHIGAPTFGDLEVGDVFLSPAAEEPEEPYIKTDEDACFNDGRAVNLTSGFSEGFDNNDAIVKVEATLTIE